MTRISRRRLTQAAALFAAAPTLISCNDGSSLPQVPGTFPAPSPQAPTPANLSPSPIPSPPPQPSPSPAPSNTLFPLTARPGLRYLVDAMNRPFMLHGDTPWSIGAQLSRSQVITYLDDRRDKGFNAIMFNAVEHEFTSQSPRWKNAEGNVPFSPDGNFGARVEAYWQLIDFIVDEANRRGIVCLCFPAYLGFGGGSQGWTSELLAESKADLADYGAWLATRYRSKGVVWCMGGDYGGDQHPGLLARQWSIATAIRSVDPAAVITAHGGRTQSAYSRWSGFPGLNLNNIYTDGVEYTYAAAEYARPGPLPFFHIEGYYDGDGTPSSTHRRQAYASILGGACGYMFGNTPIWGFGEPQANGGAGPAAALANRLSTITTMQMQYVRQLFDAYAWWTLMPRTDGSLVTSPLGSGTARICPALASDGSFALIWTAGGALTVNLAAMSRTQLHTRWFDTLRGTYAAAEAGTYTNSGTVQFTPAGECVLVIDHA
jgi:hypothetical protein